MHKPSQDLTDISAKRGPEKAFEVSYLLSWMENKNTKHFLTLPYFLGQIEACPFLISSDLFKNKLLSADKFFIYSAGKAVPKTAKAQALKTQETSV